MLLKIRELKTMKDPYDQYSMNIQYDPVDRIYVVTVPELPGCRTHGKTYEEAVRQGRDAIASWINDAIASGDPIPPRTCHAERTRSISAFSPRRDPSLRSG